MLTESTRSSSFEITNNAKLAFLSTPFVSFLSCVYDSILLYRDT